MPLTGTKPRQGDVANLIRIAAVLCAVALALEPLAGQGGARADHIRVGTQVRKPNVLVIMTDDQRVGTMKVMPATKRLIAGKGVTFRNAHATTPLCCPSRASTMTGQYAHNHMVRRNGDRDRLTMSHTLQHDLQGAGYLTAIVGKFFNGWNLKSMPPDFNQASLLGAAGSRFSSKPTDGYTRSVVSINGRLRIVSRYSTDFLAKRAIKTMSKFNRHDRRPWLMYVNTYAPHSPFIPASRHRGTRVPGLHNTPAVRERDRRDKAPEVRRQQVNRPWMPIAAKKQQRSLMAVDELVARVFRKLRRQRELNDTLVIFLSDNGFLLGEHGLTTKRWPYRHSTGVPLMMRWPGHIRKGTQDGRLVANIDIAPTVYDAAMVEPDHDIDGRSLLKRGRRRELLLENWEGTRWASLRSKRYQYIEYYSRGGDRLLFRELYKLRRDPWQLKNVLWRNGDRYKDTVRRLHSRLAKAVTCKTQACP